MRERERSGTALVVALGASNTAGYGVGAALAYPAVLEQLLNEHGVAASVHNAGVSGETTGQMLARLDASVPPGTRVVLFQPGSNDQRLGLPDAVREANIAIITERLVAREIAVIRAAAAFAAARPGNLQADGIHYTAAGHERIASLLVVDVRSALGKATSHLRRT